MILPTQCCGCQCLQGGKYLRAWLGAFFLQLGSGGGQCRSRPSRKRDHCCYLHARENAR